MDQRPKHKTMDTEPDRRESTNNHELVGTAENFDNTAVIFQALRSTIIKLMKLRICLSVRQMTLSFIKSGSLQN